MADVEWRVWVQRLRADDPGHGQALSDLRELLLRAARFEVNRRRGAIPQLKGDDLDDLAQQCADDSLVAMLRKVDDFTGESRFTTWAYKFALSDMAAKIRRLSWQGRELPPEPEGWPAIADGESTPHQDVETRELLPVLQQAIHTDLSAHQRAVLVAVTVNDVPIDVLAERLNTTRGALEKTMHDARRKLRANLAGRGLRAGRTQKPQHPNHS
ncbi:MAG: RNA polymerase sigma factor [Solirubrobacteraceae bacterium]